MVFRIHYNPESREVKVSDLDDPTSFDGFVTAMPHPNSRPGLDWHAWRWSRAKILKDHEDLEFDTSGGRLRIRTKIRDIDGMALKDVIMGVSTVTGQADLDTLGLGRLFDTPKPVALLEMLVDVATDEGDVVVDFFAGSSATAEAVMRRNARDGKARRFVMVQLDEPCAPGSAAADEGYRTIAAIGRERVRRAGLTLQQLGFSGDSGFRALYLDSPTRTDVWATPDQTAQAGLLGLDTTIKSDRTDEDVLFDVLLDLGLDSGLPIARFQVDGRIVHDVADGALMACLAESIDSDLLKEIARREPLTVVCRDSAFESDAARINAEQVFLQISPTTTFATV